jgi:hypothetical protein
VNETETTEPIAASNEKSIEKSKDDALTVLRTETALSRFPLHRIAKKSGDIAIEIHNQAAAVQWSVSHNTKYGQPGPLAYRIDTLLVNRRIEEAGKPVPRLIKLGSLPEIARELGFTGHNWDLLRRAIHQNASAYITAKISYLAADRSQRFLEAGFNRYNVIFTGEKLPSGEVAGAVYLVLSDIFLDVLNTAMWRPLDYDYMKTLPPGSQRFYEIVSYQIYAALKHKNPRAKLTYSEYCLLSTATRYLDFEHVKKQMYKILRPHIQSGYLAKVEYEATVNEKSEPDWIMYLTPGVNAGREYQAFTGVGRTRKPKRQAPMTEALTLPFATNPVDEPSAAEAGQGSRPEIGAEAAQLIERLVAAELNRSDAERFAAERPEVCERQLEFLSYVKEFKTSQGAYLRRAIENDFGPPAEYARDRKKQEQAEATKRERAREILERTLEKARQSHEERFREAYFDYLRGRVGEIQNTQPNAFMAFTQWETEERNRLVNSPLAGRKLFQATIKHFDEEPTRLERFREHFRERGTEVCSFWQWDEALNSEPFKF